MTDKPELPEPDTHCHDDDTGKDVWSHSADQMLAYGAACAAHERAVWKARMAELIGMLDRAQEHIDAIRAGEPS